MRAFVRVRAPDGEVAELGHGDIIGRLWSAALCINEPRISEAHALVSHRGDALVLLALRGRFATGGEPLTRLALAGGQAITLAPGLVLQVEEVQIPDRVLGIEGDGLPRQILPGVCSLVTLPRPSLLPSFSGEATAVFWSSGAGWLMRRAGGEAQPVLAGDEWSFDGRTFRAVEVALSRPLGAATQGSGGIDRPLRIIARYDTVHIEMDRQIIALSGIGARLISELVAFGGPVPWQVLAGELWSDESDPQVLRSRLDTALVRVRRKLREERVRPDLIRAGGTGHLELLLHPRDEVVDQA